ncbi:MAG: hypothetical protein Q8L93_03230 [Rhodocyclaceae bacterium]|nr:hypothetical protein [Rhodocyclaceae bacterium]
MLLASHRPAATTTVAAYTVPASRRATVNLALCNTGLAAARLRVAVTANNTAPPETAADWIEWDTALDPSAVLERTGIVLATGQTPWVHSTTPNVTANVWGIADLA